MRCINFRSLTATLVSTGLSLVLVAASAQAATTTVRWRHPNPEDVEVFSVHVGYSPGNYVDSLTKYFKRIEPDADGVFQTTINVEPDRQVFVAVRAYNNEAMSPFSNESDVYESTLLGAPGRPRLVDSIGD